MTIDPATRRNIAFTGDLWDRIQEAAANEGARQKRPMTMAEWIRDACERKLAKSPEGRTKGGGK